MLTSLTENKRTLMKTRTDFLAAFWILSALFDENATFSANIAVFEEFSVHFLDFFQRFGDKRNFVDDVNVFLMKFEKALTTADRTDDQTLNVKKAIVEKMAETVESGLFETEKRRLVALLNVERVNRNLGLVSLKPVGSLRNHCRYLLECFQKSEFFAYFFVNTPN